MRKKRKAFKTEDLIHIAPASAFRYAGEPPIGIGDVVRINSGGPASLVVDIDGDKVVVAWRNLLDVNDISECRFPVACVHRVADLW